MALDLVFCGTFTDLNQQAGRMLEPGELIMGMPALTGSEGIHVFRHDAGSGALTHLHTASTTNPSFLALDSTERFLFAVNETSVFGGRRTGAVSAFAVDGVTGSLRFINQVASEGTVPCHLSVSADDRFLLVANYGGGNVVVFPIGQDGTLSEAVYVHADELAYEDRSPRAHYVTPDPDGAFILSSDVGTDRISIFRLDRRTGRLDLMDPPWAKTHRFGSPRHLSFTADGRYLFANGEADQTLSVFRFDPASGALQYLDRVSTVPEGTRKQGDSTAQMIAHPSGRFVFVANRGPDSIAIIGFDPTTGIATPVGFEPTRGLTPRNFQFDPSGRFLYVANQNSGTIERFSIDQATGLLNHTGRVASVPAPVCILFTTT